MRFLFEVLLVNSSINLNGNVMSIEMEDPHEVRRQIQRAKDLEVAQELLPIVKKELRKTLFISIVPLVFGLLGYFLLPICDEGEGLKTLTVFSWVVCVCTGAYCIYYCLRQMWAISTLKKIIKE